MIDRAELVEIDQCIHCGRSESEHCIFKAAKALAGCRCNDVRTWSDPSDIPPICAEYVGSGGNCATCEHDQKCHEKH